MAGMGRHEVRYIFEHKLLPEFFYRDKERLIAIISHENKILYEIINDIFKNENVENPYKPEDFKTELFRVNEEVIGMEIKLPEPEEEPLCYFIYMLFNKDFDKAWYFTIEKGNSVGGNYPFVCAWDAEGTHINLGNCIFENNNGLIKCVDIFMENEYGLVRSEEQDTEESDIEE